MTRRAFALFLLSILVFGHSYCLETSQTVLEVNRLAKRAVTYEFSGGRFGDNVLAYMHAKWISYKYGLPFIYKPFQYSNMLMLDGLDRRYNDLLGMSFLNHIDVHTLADIEQNSNPTTLFTVPYFPESEWERKNTFVYGKPWPYVPVDWGDPQFKKLIQQLVQPKKPDSIKRLPIPKGMISVACHIRRGTGFDTPHTVLNSSLKFPPDSFFISEIHFLLALFPGEKLYVHLFTDDPNSLEIKQKYEAAFKDAPITFGCRTEKNAHNLNVLDDFFALLQFNCCIHGESNFAVCASKLCDYLYESQPTAFHWGPQTLIIDGVSRKIRKEKIEAHFGKSIIDLSHIEKGSKFVMNYCRKHRPQSLTNV